MYHIQKLWNIHVQHIEEKISKLSRGDLSNPHSNWLFTSLKFNTLPPKLPEPGLMMAISLLSFIVSYCFSIPFQLTLNISVRSRNKLRKGLIIWNWDYGMRPKYSQAETIVVFNDFGIYHVIKNITLKQTILILNLFVKTHQRKLWKQTCIWII